MEGVAIVKLSKETKARIRGAWGNALIVKMFGKFMGFHYLHRMVMSLWKPQCRVDCMDLGSGLFLFNFEAREDMDRVLSGGPWFIGGHFVAIRLWEPNFKASTTKVNTVAVWVRLNELPVEYYDIAVLRDIGNAIGPVLKVDANTASGTRGRYARICVQVDISKPLVKTILIGKLIQGVIYEGIGALCFTCGRLGHRKDDCLHVIRGPKVQRNDQHIEGERNESREVACDTSEEDGYGPWMVVNRKKTGPRRMKPVDPVTTGGSSSSLVSPTKTIIEKTEAQITFGGPRISQNRNSVEPEGLEERAIACNLAERQTMADKSRSNGNPVLEDCDHHVMKEGKVLSGVSCQQANGLTKHGRVRSTRP